MVTRSHKRRNAEFGSFARKSMPNMTWIPPPLDYKPHLRKPRPGILTEAEIERRILDKYMSPVFRLFGPGIFTPETKQKYTPEQRATFARKVPRKPRFSSRYALLIQMAQAEIRLAKTEEQREQAQSKLDHRLKQDAILREKLKNGKSKYTF